MKLDPRSFKGLSRFLAPSAGGPVADRALADHRITPDQLEECIAIQDRTGRPLDEILVEHRYLTAQDVLRYRNPALPAEVAKAAENPANCLGHYVLVSRAGMGGMAEVWKAWDRSLGRWVAVKYLKDEIGSPSQRIEREGMMAGGLSHPGIISIFERGRHENRDFLVMPFVNGAPPKPPLPPKEAARLALEVARALSHVHKNGIIHRDVKPANILVEAGGRVLLADFGLAISASSGTSRWAVSGTPEYASPEQIRGEPLDVRTDVYSLGAALYHLAVGKPPFSGKTVEEITDRVLRAPMPEPKTLPRPLARIIAKALQRDRNLRYASMEDFAKALQAYRDPIWGSLPSTRRALVLVLAAGALPWLITGVILWQRNRRENRADLLHEVRLVDQELVRVEQLFSDPEVPRENAVALAAEALSEYGRLSREWGEDPPELRTGRGRCYELIGRESEAEQLYASARSFPPALLGKARIFLRRHLAGRTDKDWRKEAASALKSLPGGRGGDLSAVLLAFAEGRLAEVLSVAQRFKDQGRYDDVFQMCVGAAAVDLKNWEEAVHSLEQAGRIRKWDPVSLYWKGTACLGKGDRAEALTAFDSALRLAPPDWELREEAQRRYEQARR